jgi:AcrR family transcriptional regulator
LTADLPQPTGDASAADAVTKSLIFTTAERLFAAHGFRNVSVRDITTEGGVNLASINYHFGSKDELLLEIFTRRSVEMNRERARLLHEATDRHGGEPPVRAVLNALLAPPLRWTAPDSERHTALQFLIRARSEGTPAIFELLTGDVSHLKRFSDALAAACPKLSAQDIHWRLHFVLGMLHNNRSAEFERLGKLSGGAADPADAEALLGRMLDFAEAGFAR